MKKSKLETIKNESEFVNLFEKVVNASIGVVMIRTREPYRAIETLRRYCAERHDPTNSDSQYEFVLWDVLHGLQTFANTRKADGTVVIEVKPTVKIDMNTLDLKKAFDKISDNAQKKPSINTINVLFSPQPFFENVGIQQHIRQFTQTALECGHRIVMLCPEVTEIPLAIENDVFVIDYLTPSMAELYNIWDNTYIGEGTPNTYFKHFTEEDKKRIIQNAMGMSASEFENAIAFAMADLGETILEKPETVKPDYIIDRLLKSKTDIIKKTDILELMQVGDLSNVGGLDLLKKWLKLRKGIFSQQARDYGIDIPKGVLLTGSPGCLSGDTLIRNNRNKLGRVHTIKEMYERLHGLDKSNRNWKNKETFIRRFTKGQIRLSPIVDVMYSGKKMTYVLELEDGKTLRATADHKILTDTGFVELRDLKKGTSIMVDNLEKTGTYIHKKRPKDKDFSIGPLHPYYRLHRHKRKNNLPGYTYGRRISLHRAVYEAGINNLTLEDFRKRTYTDVSGLTFTDPSMHIHHKDGNHDNNVFSNLECITLKEHLANKHTIESNFGQGKPAYSKVKSITPYKVEDVYDIECSYVEGEEPNFNANGIMVHNCGKSLIAKAIAGEFGLPLVKLDIGRVFSQYVGQSEQRMRKALSIVDSLGNCVLFIDEIDKGLAGTSGSGDSGTTSRVFGTLLTWLQERDKNSTVFLVATANNIVGLPPELMRKGRFDEIFYVGLPTLKERMEIFKIHLGKRNHKNDLDENALKTVAEHCDKFSGAEIEQTVVNGLIEAFSAKQEKVSMDNLIKQIKDTIPLAVSFKEKVDAMEQWAKQNARPASSGVDVVEEKPKFRKLNIGGRHAN